MIGILGSACAGSNDSQDAAAPFEDAPAEIDHATGDSESIESDEAASADSDAGAAETAGGGNGGVAAPIADYGRDLVIDASVTLVTSDVGTAVDDVVDIAQRNGGAVYNANVTVEDPLDDGSVPGSGTIEIRIPPSQLDALVSDLRGAGTLRNQTQSVDDVTEQLIDLDIQIRQAAESVERMEAILAETTDFDSLVAAETELVRRQTAYERLLAAQRNIDDRVALSKLTVQLRYQAPGTEPVEPPVAGDPGIADALSEGWNAFITVFFGVAFVVAVAAPFIGVAAVVLGIAWLISKRRRRSTPSRTAEQDYSPMNNAELVDTDA